MAEEIHLFVYTDRHGVSMALETLSLRLRYFWWLKRNNSRGCEFGRLRCVKSDKFLKFCIRFGEFWCICALPPPKQAHNSGRMGMTGKWPSTTSAWSLMSRIYWFFQHPEIENETEKNGVPFNAKIFAGKTPQKGNCPAKWTGRMFTLIITMRHIAFLFILLYAFA